MRRTLDQNDAENDEADQQHSTEPFKSPLHARFSELEERWSGIKQCSPMQRIDSSASVTSATASVRRANTALPDAPSATRRSKSEQFTASSFSAIHPYRDSNPSSSSSISQHSHQSKRSTGASSSVFERLYSHGKAKVSAARKGEAVGTSWESKPKKRQSGSFAVGLPSDASVDHSHRSGGGSTISTLSSTSSTRRSLPESRRAPQPVHRAPSKPISASSSVVSLDRGIQHPRAAHDAARRSTFNSNSSVPNLSSPMEHLLGQSIDENSRSVSSSRSKDDVFHRLYRREKRPRASLLASYQGPTTTPPSIHARAHPGNQEQDKDKTPLRRGGESRSTHREFNIDSVRTTSYDATGENESFYSTNSDGRQSGSASDESLLVVRSCGDNANAIDVEDSADRLTDNKASDNVSLPECAVHHTPRVFHDPLAFTPHMFTDPPLAERANTVRERHSAKKIQRAFRRNLGNASNVETHSNAATAIQKSWRMYLGERKLIDLMIVGWWMKCDFASSLDYNRVLIMKMGLESLKKVIRQVYGMEHVTALELESDRISIEWTREVLVEVDFQGSPVMEIVVVRLKCSARRPAFVNHWSSEKTISRVVRAALSKTVKRDQRKFFHVCAKIIQIWARKVAARQQLRASGFLRQVEATNNVILATCLTPTSRERNAAIRIQCAWRCHRAQLCASSLLLTSWTSECALQHSSVCNTILQQKIRLLAVSKAIGQVDCWWLTEAIEIFADCISVSWQREVGIHYEHQGSRHLESCVVQLTCQAARSSVNATWDQRKMGIMLIKAALERVFVRDRNSLRFSSVVMIQSWWRMIPRRRNFLMSTKVDREAMTLKLTQLSVNLQTFWRSYIQRNRYSALRASCITLQRVARKYNEHSAQARAATLIQHSWRKSSVRSSCNDSSGSFPHFTQQSSQSRNTYLAAHRGLSRCQAIVRGRSERIKCLRKKIAITSIQRYWRRSAAVRTLRRRKAAAVIIQSLSRCSRQRIVFRRMQADAVQIQALVRARIDQKIFLTMKAGIVIIQSQARRLLAQSQLVHRRTAALAIKNAWRQYRVRRQLRQGKQLVALHDYAIMIQARFRGHQRSRAFIQQKRCAALAQRVWRGGQARQRLRTEMEATRRIQTAWRRHREHQCSQRAQQHFALEALATRIQAHIRAHLMRNAFVHQKGSAVFAQRVWRGSQARNRWRVTIAAVRRIQTVWCRHHAKLEHAKAHAEMVALATFIQAQVRAHLHRSAFLQQKRSAVKVQRVWKGSVARNRWRATAAAVRRIQTVWHRHHAKLQRAQKHAEMTALVTLIQAQVRAHRHRSAFLQQKRSAVIAQRVWLGRLARKRVRTEMEAIRRIQTLWRRHREHQCSQRAQLHLALEGLATRIQAQVRAHRTRNAFVHQKGSAVCAQRVWRGSQARCRWRVTITAVHRIQTVWRRHHAKLQSAQVHAEMTALAGLIQAQFRAHLHRSAFLQQKRSAVIAQRVWRGSEARNRWRVTIAAVRRIQTVWRRHHAKLQRAQKDAEMVALATLIQAQVRAHRHRSAFLQLKRSAVIVQRVWRGSVTKNRWRATTAAVRRIQTVWHRHHAKLQRAQEHAEMAALATLIQAQVRAHRHRSAFLQQKRSAVIAQRVWRRVLARKENKSLSAIAIQRNWRRFRRESHYFAILMAVLAIQSWFRQVLWTRRVVRGVQRLQAASRGARSRRTFLRMKKSADTIQRTWRRHYTKMSQTRAYSVTRIQTVARSRISRMYVTRYRSMVIRVQASLRRFLVKIAIARLTSEAKSIQSFWRSHIARSRFLDVRSSATVLQKWARMALARKVFLEERGAALVMQYYWRRLVCKRAREVVLRCAIFLQKTTRCHLAHQRYLKAKRGICLLQALVRRSLKRSLAKNWRASLNAAVSIQSIARKKFERDSYVNLRDSAVMIQRNWRMRNTVKRRRQDLALASFQASIRAKLAGSLFAQQKGAARVIQAAFFVWKMNLTLLEVQSSVVLLKRSIRGQLERSATRFALSHVNDSRRSFERMSHTSFHFDTSIFLAWSEAESMAKECAAVVIQGSIRRFIAIVRTREMVEESLCPASETKIGSRWRIILLRQDENATIIQARFRAFQKRQELKTYRAAATLLQTSYRSHNHTRNFSRLKTSIIKIQHLFRMRQSRTISAAHNIAARLIQATVRGYQARTQHYSAVESVRVIQSFWRRHVESTRKTEELVSAIRIQKWTKAIKRRRTERRELALATEREIHFVEKAILLEMERNARDQVGLLLLKTRRVRPTSACVRRLAKRVKSLSQDCKENHSLVKSNNAGLITVYKQGNYPNSPI